MISVRKNPLQLRNRDGFLLVTLTWFFMSFLGSLPYYLSGQGMSITDSIFESACGFATTGATTINDVEVLPYSLLLWRSLSYWAGGMGIIVLTVALLPLLGVGGFQLVKAESSGPEKEKITPKITAASKILWLIYITLTFVLFVLYCAGGMPLFDALCHSFTTMATGGASTKNTGLSFFNSHYIEIITTIFMLLSAFNFNLYVRILNGKIKDVFFNTEARLYIFVFVTAVILITVDLIPYYHSAEEAIRYAAFNTASILSTTGNTLNNYELWPPLAKTTLLILMLLGGCSGSTAGGIKIIRVAVLFKQAGNEIKRLIYPRGIFSVRLNNKMGRKDVVYGVAGFICLYFAVIGVTALITAASGIDITTSISASLAVTSNVGVGFGGVGPQFNYGFFPDHIKWLFSFDY
jgi:trk system potassium uptake protein TrkH